MSGLDMFFDLNRDGHVSAGEAMFVIGSHLENYRAIAEDEARYELERQQRSNHAKPDYSRESSSPSYGSTLSFDEFLDLCEEVENDSCGYDYDADEDDYRDYDQEASDLRLSLAMEGIPNSEIRCYNCKHWKEEYDFFLRSSACDVWHKLEKKMDDTDYGFYIQDLSPADDDEICYKFKMKKSIMVEYGL